MNSPIIFSSEQQAILDVLYQNALTSTDFVSASGTTSVTINSKRGIATFTDTVAADSAPTFFTINNSLITESSIIALNLSYTPSGDEMCAIAAYQSFTGSVRIYFTNYSTANADEPKVVSFQILN